jgi:hypothetical protein
MTLVSKAPIKNQEEDIIALKQKQEEMTEKLNLTKIAKAMEQAHLPFDLVSENRNLEIASSRWDGKKEQPKLIKIELAGNYEDDFIRIKNSELSYKDLLTLVKNFPLWMQHRHKIVKPTAEKK